MKYLFVVTIAVFAFTISCAKKDNKPSVGKSGAGGQLDCKVKDKDNKTCVAQAKDAAALAASKVSPNGAEGPKSGATEAKEELDTLPNLVEFNKMSLTLSKDTALIVNLKTAALNDEFVAAKIICASDMTKPDKAVTADPDKLEHDQSQIYLFNNSSIVATTSVSKDDNEKVAKLYMYSCASGSSATLKNSETSKSVNLVNLKIGQNTFESVALRGKPTVGILTSFECNDDTQILEGTAKMQGDLAANRIRIRKGSALLVYRAHGQKFGEKTLKESGTEAQNKEFTVISCEG